MIEAEKRGFIYGFVATVGAGIVTLFIYQKYIAQQAAVSALENYTQKYGLMSTYAYNGMSSRTPSVLTSAQTSTPSTTQSEIRLATETPTFTTEARLNAFGMQ